MASKDRDAAQRGKIGLREVRALQVGETLWDAGAGAVSGFGVRRRAGPGASYFIMYRTSEGRQRRYTIGQHGAPWTPDTARDKALTILAEVRGKGIDPAADKRKRRESLTIDDLCTLYLGDADAGRLLTRRGATKKASTLATDKGRIIRHIRPLIGKSKVASVTRQDVERFMHAVADGKTAQRVKTEKKHGLAVVRGGKGTATRTLGLLGGLFTYAVKQGMRADNPVTGLVRFADGRRERRLSDAEYERLGAGLRLVAQPGKPRKDGKPPRGGMWPDAIVCAQFLAVTGWRSGEALDLRWRDVDLVKRTARLPDTKTGASVRPLSNQACDILLKKNAGKSDAHVFPSSRGNKCMTGFPSFFDRIKKAGKLPADVTPHVLRHSFASMANDLGYTEATVGMLVGHKGGGTTRGYIHGADAVLLAAADKVANHISGLMGYQSAMGKVVPLRGGTL
jgi:integrase